MATPPAYGEQEGRVEEAELRDRLLAGEPDLDVDALLARTRAAVIADVGAVASARRWSTPARTGVVLAVAVAVAVLSLLGAPRADLAHVSPAMIGLVSAGMLAGALAAVALAMRPTWKPEISGPRAALVVATALAAPALFLWIPVVDPVHAFTLDEHLLIPATLGCFLFGSAAALLVGGTWRMVEQRSSVGPLHWATAVSAAAAVGNLALVLHCPVARLDHQLFGHLSIGLVWAGIAALVAHYRR